MEGCKQEPLHAWPYINMNHFIPDADDRKRVAPDSRGAPFLFPGKVGVPRQLVVKRDASSIPDFVAEAGLRLPLDLHFPSVSVAKPLVNDGSAKSHELSLAYDRYSLQKLEPPLVLQEFVNHGCVLFKVFIVGEAIKVVRRFSLPNVTKQDLSNDVGVYRLPRVSRAAASADDADLDPKLPPLPLLERLAKELRQKLGLRLFNLDIIREHGTRDHYKVTDINYFPGKSYLYSIRHHSASFLPGLKSIFLFTRRIWVCHPLHDFLYL
ncbi:Inositol-tetrakisphosphate 1-kinase 3 [Hibiscus syriacus]|uniref:inositol-1,3,4-trisphosphate 5/6-kinase n=1 Tax=Hibiscus syriacus TaxID=106335 RepID=A0A6A3B0Y4_HIBSY|nr:Inositol-tetrakisphosphate 1-kinase 3 [Hibiscus syriacus]